MMAHHDRSIHDCIISLAKDGLSWAKCMVISRLKEAGLRAQHTAVKEILTDEHNLYCLAFAESNVRLQMG